MIEQVADDGAARLATSPGDDNFRHRIFSKWLVGRIIARQAFFTRRSLIITMINDDQKRKELPSDSRFGLIIRMINDDQKR
jgi:hypothetical protein